MKLLIITQKVDLKDDVLGFFHRWLELFSQEVEELFVITQFLGAHDLPQNTILVSLGKERGWSKWRQLLYFWKYVAKYTKEADAVFVHMVPLWVNFGIPFYFLYRKPVYLWYIHPRKDWMYRLARMFVKKVFTAVRSEGYDKKLTEVGHGIDIELFTPRARKLPDRKRIITVGRIAPIKKYLEMLFAVEYLINNLGFQDIRFDFIGTSSSREDILYYRQLQEFIQKRKLDGFINFLGKVSFNKIQGVYHSADLLLNFTPSGSFDKTVLEAMSSNIPVLVASPLFTNVLSSRFVIVDINNKEMISFNIKNILENKPRLDFRKKIEQYHNLYILIPRLIKEM